MPGEYYYALAWPSSSSSSSSPTDKALCMCFISKCGSSDSGNADCRQQRNNTDPLLPPAASAALRPRNNESVYALGGRNSKPQNSTPASGPPFNNDDAPVSNVADRSPTTSIPCPLLTIVGLLALFWVWVIDGTVMVLQPRLRLRRGTFGRAAVTGREKGGCRCRVCILRVQANGRPLHNVRENVV